MSTLGHLVNSRRGIGFPFSCCSHSSLDLGNYSRDKEIGLPNNEARVKEGRSTVGHYTPKKKELKAK